MKKMFLKIILLFVLTFPNLTFAQWQWAQSHGSAIGTDLGKGVAIDKVGNIYVTGDFSGDSICFGSYTLYNSGQNNVFVVKYSPSGIVLWAQRFGGSYYDVSSAIATDASGNVFITGQFYSPSIAFGSYTLTNTSALIEDVYIAKLSSSGAVLWAKKGGGIKSDETISLCTDVGGNVYVAGEFNSPSVAFGSFTINNSSTDTLDLFIVKYDPAGNIVWAKGAGGHRQDGLRGITSDNAGHIFITGYFGSPVCNFGALSLTNTSSYPYEEAFIAKYDTSGTVLWARKGTGDGFESGTGVAADTSGNIYVSGGFTGQYLAFGNDTVFNAYSFISEDIFIAKYNPSGTLIWLKSLGSEQNDHASAIDTDVNGNVYITGCFKDSISFGGTTFYSVGEEDVFLAKYNSAGIPIASYNAGGNDMDVALGLDVDILGKPCITGYYIGTTISFGSTVLVNSGLATDMFTAKISLITGIEEKTINTEKGFEIYPNPSSGIIALKYSSFKGKNLQIINAFGETIYQSQFEESQSIDLRHVSSGVYFIRITDENKHVSTKKIILAN